ncbi:MAG: T9SS type A sorting domain-containing protein [Bacteroidota bacterium]|nr:T9SS type A sorting domain-containing protein [Bacteroidota bacterium]
MLNEGAYTITADKVGYESGQTQTNTVDYTQQNSPSDFQLKAEQTTSVGNPGAEIPESYALFQNYPNPFNPTTEIRYQIAEVSRVTLKIYNLLGQEVATLVSEKKSPGTYEVSFDGSSLPSGLYFYRLDAGNFSGVKKMLMLK